MQFFQLRYGEKKYSHNGSKIGQSTCRVCHENLYELIYVRYDLLNFVPSYMHNMLLYYSNINIVNII